MIAGSPARERHQSVDDETNDVWGEFATLASSGTNCQQDTVNDVNKTLVVWRMRLPSSTAIRASLA